MPCTTFLSDHQIKQWSHVENDKDCDELLKELNEVSGRLWLVGVQEWFLPRGLFRHAEKRIDYTLYLDCHGEWQVMNMVTPEGGSLFHHTVGSREHVMNYMLGFIAGARP